MPDNDMALANPLDQFSPRASASWSFAPGWTWNANAGIYHQLPAYTVMGYAASVDTASATLVNWHSGMTYTTNRQLVMGFKREYRQPQRGGVARGLLQGLRGVAGERQLGHRLGQPWGGLRGRGQRGSDVRRRRAGAWHGSLAATTPVQGVLRLACLHARAQRYINPGEELALLGWTPSSWDNRHIVSFTGGKKWDSGWELGARVLFSGGLPYTPYDVDQSLLIANWEAFNGRCWITPNSTAPATATFTRLTSDWTANGSSTPGRWTCSWTSKLDRRHSTPASPVGRAAQSRPAPHSILGHAWFLRPSVHHRQRGRVLPAIGSIVEL